MPLCSLYLPYQFFCKDSLLLGRNTALTVRAERKYHGRLPSGLAGTRALLMLSLPRNHFFLLSVIHVDLHLALHSTTTRAITSSPLGRPNALYRSGAVHHGHLVSFLARPASMALVRMSRGIWRSSYWESRWTEWNGGQSVIYGKWSIHGLMVVSLTDSSPFAIRKKAGIARAAQSSCHVSWVQLFWTLHFV